MRAIDLKGMNEDEIERRVVIMRDDDPYDPRTEQDNAFVLWSNVDNLCSDKNAECPYERDGNGEWRKRDGVVVFPVSMYEHGMRTFKLGSSRGFPDRQWDCVDNAMFIYTDREHWDRMFGKDSFANSGADEFRRIAGREIKELNLAEHGEMYGWQLQEKVKWHRIDTYPNGMRNEIDGFTWECVDSCWGYLTDNPEKDMDLPEGIPVYADL